MTKTRLQTKLSLSTLINGEFWFEYDKLNVADKVINHHKNKAPHVEHINTYESKDFFDFLNDKSIDENKSATHVSGGKDTSLNSNTPPIGYIRLYLDDIGINQLFLKHKITLKYLNLRDDLYIKSFILGVEQREIDCYHDGENKSLTIKKVNDSQLMIKLLECGGGKQEISIVNGVIIG